MLTLILLYNRKKLLTQNQSLHLYFHCYVVGNPNLDSSTWKCCSNITVNLEELTSITYVLTRHQNLGLRVKHSSYPEKFHRSEHHHLSLLIRQFHLPFYVVTLRVSSTRFEPSTCLFEWQCTVLKLFQPSTSDLWEPTTQFKQT